MPGWTPRRKRPGGWVAWTFCLGFGLGLALGSLFNGFLDKEWDACLKSLFDHNLHGLEEEPKEGEGVDGTPDWWAVAGVLDPSSHERDPS